MTSHAVTIEIDKQSLHFSAAHFTVFSATERERLHGHNFSLRVRVNAHVRENGLAFDYNELKQALLLLCEGLDEYTLIPQYSSYLDIKEQGEYFAVMHNQKTLLLLKTDTVILPLFNITLEELGRYFIEQLHDRGVIAALGVDYLQVEVASGPGQWVSSFFGGGDGGL